MEEGLIQESALSVVRNLIQRFLECLLRLLNLIFSRLLFIYRLLFRCRIILFRIHPVSASSAAAIFKRLFVTVQQCLQVGFLIPILQRINALLNFVNVQSGILHSIQFRRVPAMIVSVHPGTTVSPHASPCLIICTVFAVRALLRFSIRLGRLRNHIWILAVVPIPGHIAGHLVLVVVPVHGHVTGHLVLAVATVHGHVAGI